MFYHLPVLTFVCGTHLAPCGIKVTCITCTLAQCIWPLRMLSIFACLLYVGPLLISCNTPKHCFLFDRFSCFKYSASFSPNTNVFSFSTHLILTFSHDDVIKWKHFPRNWPFVRGIHRSPVISPHKGQWRGALMYYLICAWTNGWANNREAGDLRRHHAQYDVKVMNSSLIIGCWCAYSVEHVLKPQKQASDQHGKLV